ncbi:MAG TPA: toxin TcdB middle/C-terminal domain-containing protein, partial [Polyangiaceae bacterium]|nr:toxin TcdB middle/C-terminal domain-containing protein [Polyangiaceae bacterium]
MPWVTRLPFPVHVVERVEKVDHVSKTKLVSRYRYHHGFYDGVEREYRGFAYVEQWDAESFDGGAHELVRPPMRMRSWFHTGAWLHRERLERKLAEGYWAGDPSATPVPPTAMPRGLSASEEREAMRALRGRMLRQETFAEDRTPESAHPYSVEEQNYEIRKIQGVHGAEHGVFFVHARERVTSVYERHPEDPRVSQELILDVDEFGNVTRAVAIAYPRRSPREPEQAKLWAVLSESVLRNRPGRDTYRLGVPLETRSSEITGLSEGERLSCDQVSDLLAQARMTLRLVAHTRRNYYRDDLSGPLPWGEIGIRALPYETYKWAFTEELLAEAFDGRVDSALLLEGAYVFRSDAGALSGEGTWWAPSGRLLFDPEKFYRATAAIDAFGAESKVRYDRYALLVAETEDALGNLSTAGHRNGPERSNVFDGLDYRTLAASLVTDANENRTAVGFDALGLPIRIARMGKAGAHEGDSLEEPTLRIEYDLHRYARTRGAQPVFVHTLAREHYGAKNTRYQEAYSYADGAAREVMRKVRAARAEDGRRRWIGSGRQVFDNKGNPVKKYEPFFSDDFEYEDERALVESGVTPILHYDPLGRLIRTDLPDGTFTRVVFDAWSQETWDANDTVLESRWYQDRGAPDPLGPQPAKGPRRAAWLTAQCARTPTRVHLDALGRTFLTEVDNRDPAGPYRTRLELDITGNTLGVIDARGIRTLDRQVFDRLGRPLLTLSPDAGWERILPNVTGNAVRRWDARGHTLRYRYDGLRRLTHVFVRDRDDREILATRHIFGESRPDAIARNLRARAFRTYDSAGASTNEQFDFRGNLLRTSRALARADRAAIDWSSVDSEPTAHASAHASPPLEDEVFHTSTSYDALDRITSNTTPDGSVTFRHYDDGGLLDRVEVALGAFGGSAAR